MESPILEPPPRNRSRPSTPGASFLHKVSFFDPRTHTSTSSYINTAAPRPLHTSSSLPSSPVRSGGTDTLNVLDSAASRSKTSLTLSLPEEENFGQPSIDLPGLVLPRDIFSPLRIEERRSVMVVEEVKNEENEEKFEDVVLREDGGERSGGVEQGQGQGHPEVMSKVEEDLDQRQRGEEAQQEFEFDGSDDEIEGFSGRLGKFWESINPRCCCRARG